MSIGNRIREIRRKLNINQAAFADLLGLTQQAISAYENGKYEPDTEALEKIARSGRVTLDWLMTGAPQVSEEMKLFRGVNLIKMIPIVSRVTAGPDPSYFYREEDITGQLPVPESMSKNFALEVEGDSMYNPAGPKSINDGDYVIVDPEAQIIPGDIVVIIAGGRQMVKQLMFQNGHYTLKSWNQNYPDLTFPQDDVAIMKRVVAIQPKMIKT